MQRQNTLHFETIKAAAKKKEDDYKETKAKQHDVETVISRILGDKHQNSDQLSRPIMNARRLTLEYEQKQERGRKGGDGGQLNLGSVALDGLDMFERVG